MQFENEKGIQRRKEGEGEWRKNTIKMYLLHMPTPCNEYKYYILQASIIN